MAYFAIAADGDPAHLVNVETWTRFPPHVLPDGAIALMGKVRRRALAGGARHDGMIDGVLRFDHMMRADLNAFVGAVFGGFTTASRFVALTLIDELGYYSPFLGTIEKPSYTLVKGDRLREVVFPLAALELQSATKTGAAALTAADRLVYGDTSGGSFALTLPPASTVGADTVIGIEKASAAHLLTVEAGAGDTIDTGTVTLADLRRRVTLASDGVSAWKQV